MSIISEDVISSGYDGYHHHHHPHIDCHMKHNTHASRLELIPK